jgi:hypothetical protein
MKKFTNFRRFLHIFRQSCFFGTFKFTGQDRDSAAGNTGLRGQERRLCTIWPEGPGSQKSAYRYICITALPNKATFEPH